jgi:hypothetical protein
VFLWAVAIEKTTGFRGGRTALDRIGEKVLVEKIVLHAHGVVNEK